VPRDYLPALVAAVCFMWTLTNIEAAVLLVLRGMGPPARIMLRASMESLFKLKAVERDRNVTNAILAGDDEFRRKLLEKYNRLDNPQLKAELERIAIEERHSREVQGMGREGTKRRTDGGKG